MSTDAEQLEDLASLMSYNTSLNPEYPYHNKKHPRFADFKNAGKAAASQKERRAEVIKRINARRQDAYNEQRSLPMLDDEEDYEDNEEEDYVHVPMDAEEATEEDSNAFRLHRQVPVKRKYRDQLMLSEWLIDIPDNLQGAWTMVASPKGKRCLVVAVGGNTYIYSKNGVQIASFKSGIPNGGPFGGHGKTILDCIRSAKNDRHFYILDVIYATMMSFCDETADARLNQVNAIKEEIVINTQKLKGKKKPLFFVPPRCPCNAEEMAKMMAEPMKFELDGLLFYNNVGWYNPGYTPLVGWLEPWMLPEVLNVPIHDVYKASKENDLPLKEYVEDYNDKHNHKFVHGKPGERKNNVSSSQKSNTPPPPTTNHEEDIIVD